MYLLQTLYLIISGKLAYLFSAPPLTFRHVFGEKSDTVAVVIMEKQVYTNAPFKQRSAGILLNNFSQPVFLKIVRFIIFPDF